MREIVMDATNWKAADDVYDSFFKAVGAPTWHGRNFNALRDGIAAGHINQIEAPYLIKLANYSHTGPDAKEMADHFIELIGDLKKEGCPVDIEVES